MGVGKEDANARKTTITLPLQVEESEGVRFWVLRILDTVDSSVLQSWSLDFQDAGTLLVEVQNLRKAESEV